LSGIRSSSSICAQKYFSIECANPAEALGLRAKGELRIGFDADCAIVDNWMNVEGVILKGEIVS